MVEGGRREEGGGGMEGGERGEVVRTGRGGREGGRQGSREERWRREG